MSYANKYLTSRNSTFYNYNGSSWDCTNFVSQCISYGFGSGSSMTSLSSFRMENGSSYSTGWYAHGNGGSKNWEQVNSLWSYITASKSTLDEGARANIVSLSNLNEGGIMQLDFQNDSDFDHSLILVDDSTQKYAQHQSDTYRYYSDFSGYTKRFFNPSYFRQY